MICKIQLALNVQIPVEYGGLGGKVVYIRRYLNYVLLLVINLIMLFLCHNGEDKHYACLIDTEGSFMVERVYQIAEGCIMETLDKFGHHKKVILACQEQMQPSSFLADIFYFRICSYTEEIAMINCLEKFLAEKKDAFGRSEGEVLLLDDGTASEVKQIFREANVAADWMASYVANHSVELLWSAE